MSNPRERLEKNTAGLEQGEYKAQENAENQHLILDALPSAVVMIKPDGSVVYVNQSFRSQFDSFLKKNTLSFFEDTAERTKILESIHQQGYVENYELSVQKKDGSLVWVLISARPIKFEREDCFLFSLVDITARKQDEEKLRKSEDKFFKAFHANQTAIAISRLKDGYLLEVNDAFEKTYGYQRNELLGKTTLELGLWVNLAEREQIVQTLQQQGFARGQELQFRTKKGIIFGRMSCELIELDGETCILFDIIDVTERKWAEEALKDSEQQFRSLFENMTNGFALHEMIFDDNGYPVDYRFLEVNPAFEKLTGTSTASILGKTVKEVMPDIEQYWIDTYGKVVITGEPVAYQNYSKELNKHYDTWVFSPRKGQFAVVFNDITERKQSDEKLTQQVKRLNTLHAVEQAVISSKELSKILELLVCETVEQLEVDASSVLLLNLHTNTLDFAARQGFHTDALMFTSLGLGSGLAGRAAQERRVIYIANLAEMRDNPVLMQAIADEKFVTYFGIPLLAQGNLLGVLEIFHRSELAPDPDWLTFLETLADQAAIAMDNARLLEITQQSLMETSALYRINQGLIATIDPEELMEDVVELLQKNFGYYYVQVFVVEPITGDFVVHAGSGELGMKLKNKSYRLAAGDGIVGLTAETGKPFFTNNVDEVISFIRPPFLENTSSELAVPIKVGTKFLGLLDIHQTAPAYLTDRDVQLVSVVADQLAVALQKAGLYADLQEALYQEQSVRSQLVQSEKLAASGRLLASVSHELNNPIQAIQNALFLLKEEHGISDQGKQDLQIVLSETERMASMLERLRTTYQPVSSEDFKPVQLNDIIEDVCALVATHFRHNKISFEFRAAPEIPPVPGLDSQIRQVILNLFMNSVDAMSDGGHLMISTQFLEESREVLVTVSDTGPGIESAILPRIFDAFVTNKERGTGLGLAISHEIILKHRGRIHAENNLERGATFQVWFPVDI